MPDRFITRVSDRRLQRMRRGADALGRWLAERAATGLATLADDPELVAQRSAQLAEDQLGSLARWLDFVGERAREGQWKAVAGELGRLALLARMWERFDALPAGGAEALLVRCGVAPRRNDVLERGERVPGLWSVVGSVLTQHDSGLATRRTALLGPRPALVVEHGFGGLGDAPPLGVEVFAELCFYPGPAAVRAVLDDAEPTAEWGGDGALGLDEALSGLATQFAANPLTGRVPLALREVRPVTWQDGLWLVDRDGRGLPVVGQPWELLAADEHVVVAGLWTGRALRATAMIGPTGVAEVAPAEPSFGDEGPLDPLTRDLLLGAPIERLWEAGMRSLERRGAPVLARVPVPEPVRRVRRPSLSAASSARLERLVGRTPEVMDELLGLLAERQLAPGDALLPRLFDLPAAWWPRVDALLGPAERATATLDERWLWAAQVPLPPLDDALHQLPELLHAGLRDQPQSTLAWIEAGWESLGSGDRVTVLASLGAAATPAETVVERGLSDRSAAVRRAASRALAEGQPLLDAPPQAILQLLDRASSPQERAAVLRRVPADNRPAIALATLLRGDGPQRFDALEAVVWPWPSELVRAWRTALQGHLEACAAGDRAPDPRWSATVGWAAARCSAAADALVREPFRLPSRRIAGTDRLIVALRRAVEVLDGRRRLREVVCGADGAIEGVAG